MDLVINWELPVPAPLLISALMLSGVKMEWDNRNMYTGFKSSAHSLKGAAVCQQCVKVIDK